MQASFWEWRNYCVSKQPTSYILEPNTQQEFSAVGFSVLYVSGLTSAGSSRQQEILATPFRSYFSQYAISSYYLWIGAYYQNGNFHWLNGDPWSWNAVLMNPMNPPKNGSCVEFDPRKTTVAWDYQACDNANGATICEMEPLRK